MGKGEGITEVWVSKTSLQVIFQSFHNLDKLYQTWTKKNPGMVAPTCKPSPGETKAEKSCVPGCTAWHNNSQASLGYTGKYCLNTTSNKDMEKGKLSHGEWREELTAVTSSLTVLRRHLQSVLGTWLVEIKKTKQNQAVKSFWQSSLVPNCLKDWSDSVNLLLDELAVSLAGGAEIDLHSGVLFHLGASRNQWRTWTLWTVRACWVSSPFVVCLSSRGFVYMRGPPRACLRCLLLSILNCLKQCEYDSCEKTRIVKQLSRQKRERRFTLF